MKHNESVSYNPNEVMVTHEVTRMIHNAFVKVNIETIRKAMDACDDVQMREHLAKKLNREKRKLLTE